MAAADSTSSQAGPFLYADEKPDPDALEESRVSSAGESGELVEEKQSELDAGRSGRGGGLAGDVV